MTHRETRFVAESVVGLLKAREYLRTKINHDITHLVAKRIENARAEYAESRETQKHTKISEGVALLKKSIREIIPPTFGWWLELDHDVRISVRWIWLGHPAVVHSGAVSDMEPTILLHLLRTVDWAAEATEAMVNVEESEALILRAAQDRRRLKLSENAHTLAALPPVELPAPVPITLEQKRREKGPIRPPRRRETREEMTARIQAAIAAAQAEQGRSLCAPHDDPWEDQPTDEQEADEPLQDEQDGGPDAAPAPVEESTQEAAPGFPAPISYEERHASAPGTTRHVHEEGLPPLEYGLSRQIVRTSLSRTLFEAFETLNDLLDAIRANPPGTFTEAYVMRGMARLKGPEQVWGMIGKGPMPGRERSGRPLREMTAREFRRIDSGEPRAAENRFFRTG